MTAQISLHCIVDNATEQQLDRALLYLIRIKARMVTIAAGAQLDRGMLFVERVRKEIPGIKVFWRHLEDTGIWLRQSPPAWWITRVERFPATLEWAKRNEIIFVTDNETSGDDETIRRYVEWQVAVLKLLHAQGLHAAVGRFATGNIQESQYKLLKPMFDAMDAGDYFSPNEYFNSPAGSSAGHLNRYKLAWEANGKPLPTAIGEFGMAANYQSDKGYLSTNISGKMTAQIGIKHFEDWYKSNDVSVFWYCVGGFSWPNFQINEELYEALEAYANAPATVPAIPDKPNAVIPAPIPTPIPKPTTAGDGIRVEAMSEYDVFTGYPRAKYPVVSTTFGHTGEAGDILRIWPDEKREADGRVYIYASILQGKNLKLSGWLVLDTFEYIQRDSTAEVPKVPEDEASNYVVVVKAKGLTKAQAEALMKLFPTLEVSIAQESAA